MIDFNAISRCLDRIDRPIGGEFYYEFKNNDDFNVYNEYDPTGNTLILPKKKLILYQTDRTFTEKNLSLLDHYDKIYAVNNIVTNNSRVVSIPLGMVDIGKCINFALCYKYKDFSTFDLIKECRYEYKSYPDKLIYLNFRLQSDTQTDRLQSLRMIESLSQDKFTNDVYCGSRWLLFDSRENIKKFYMKCLDHVFIACPQGFGIDTYRFYEMLYLGRIPVVLHNPVTDMFNDLPILFLDKWEDFYVKQQEFIDNFNINNFNFDKLTVDYWKKILIENN